MSKQILGLIALCMLLAVSCTSRCSAQALRVTQSQLLKTLPPSFFDFKHPTYSGPDRRDWNLVSPSMKGYLEIAGPESAVDNVVLVITSVPSKVPAADFFATISSLMSSLDPSWASAGMKWFTLTSRQVIEGSDDIEFSAVHNHIRWRVSKMGKIVLVLVDATTGHA